MPAPTLFETAFDNRGLFSDYYLEERFPERDDVQALQQEANAAFDQLRDLYRRVASEVDTWNEDQTEDNFVRPVLKNVLGWARKVQPHVQKQGRKGRPDYALFASDDRRTTAVGRADGDETKVFNYADAVADAKYWGRPLDGPALDPEREKRAEMRRNNPSFQIIDYVTITGVEWGILTNGARWRLYYEGAPSRLETYFEVNLPEIIRLAEGNEEDRDEARRAFRLFYALFRADAYRPTVEGEKFVDVVYSASDTYAETLEDELKERVFDHVFLELATGLYEDHVRENSAGDPEAVLDDVYRATLRLLYRLLFLLYAESRDLLPLDNSGYYEKSLTHIAEEARRKKAAGHPISRKHSEFWNVLQGLFQTIDRGDDVLDVPAYNGGLFREGNEANAFLDSHEIGERYVVNALVNLTAVDPKIPEGPDGEYPSVDYTSLDVRQLGSIYEGLLEHRLVITDDDDLDLQTDEGERKETGSYYTPHYVVEYIVEETLGPIVDERIQQFEDAMEEIAEILDGHDPDDPGVQAKLDAPRQKALDAFLTVRVCDPAMGSGHFLVYAADYLAERFGQILGRYPDNNPVTQQLEEIRQSILDELVRQGIETDGLAEDNRLRDTSLLKRLVMKRCIYGVDLNPMAVELAKLSLWLHSFTVGAPLSFLDHHLKAGNSLIGTQVDTVAGEIQADLFGDVRREILRGTQFLQDAAFNTDATLTDVEQSAKSFETYQSTMRPYKRLLDLWTAQHFGVKNTKDLVFQSARDMIMAHQNDAEDALRDEHDAVAQTAQLREEKQFFHWELEFPEVFYELDPPGIRDNPGFDVVIGNPPYLNMDQVEDGISSYLNQVNPRIWMGQSDIYYFFIYKGVRLLKDDGRVSLIVSRYFMESYFARGIRQVILEKTKIESIVDFGHNQPFKDALVNPAIINLRRGDIEGDKYSGAVLIRDRNMDVEKELKDGGEHISFDQNEMSEKPWRLHNQEQREIIDKISSQRPLSEYAIIGMGMQTGENEVFRVSEHEASELNIPDDWLRPVIANSDIHCHHIGWKGDYWIYLEDVPEDDLREKEDIFNYLKERKGDLKDRIAYERGDCKWFRYSYPRYKEIYFDKKIMTRYMSTSNKFAIDEEGKYISSTDTFIISVDRISCEFVVSILNSNMMNWWFLRQTKQKRGGYYSYSKESMSEIPIPSVEFTTPAGDLEDYIDTLIDRYETARAVDSAPTDNSVLDAIANHLSGDPERLDVIHNLLSHLAREMTDLKSERATYDLDITEYLPEPSTEDGVAITEIGRYEPVSGVTDSILAETKETREKLHIGSLHADVEENCVTVQATARYKPDESDAYIETDPIDFCKLKNCTDEEVQLLEHWLNVLSERTMSDSTFAGYRANATTNISLRNRLFDARFPDLDQRSTELAPFFRDAKEAAELDRQIEFTDELIDQIVYRLYGLNDEEIAVIEN